MNKKFIILVFGSSIVLGLGFGYLKAMVYKSIQDTIKCRKRVSAVIDIKRDTTDCPCDSLAL